MMAILDRCKSGHDLRPQGDWMVCRTCGWQMKTTPPRRGWPKDVERERNDERGKRGRR